MPKPTPRRRTDSAPGADAPARPVAPPPDPGRLLLAKILGVIIGTLSGLFIAILIGYLFVGEWTARRAVSSNEMPGFQQELDE